MVLCLILLWWVNRKDFWRYNNSDFCSTCLIYNNNGQWHRDMTHCQFVKDHNFKIFQTFVRPLLYPTSSESNTSLKSTLVSSEHYLFAGDSTMFRLVNHIPLPDLHPDDREGLVVKSASRCDLMEYFNLSRAEIWKLPSLDLEGPCAYGLQNPFCNDCSGCNANRRVFRRSRLLDNVTTQTSYEYVPIEFARDTEFQTPTTTTSQKSLALYLQALPYKHDACVMSAGIHDIALKNVTFGMFASNVFDYIARIKSFCKRIMWLLPSASQYLLAVERKYLRSCRPRIYVFLLEM